MTPILRRQIYTLLIVISAAIIFGRIAAIDSVSDRIRRNLKMAQIPSRLQEEKAKWEAKGESPEVIRQRLTILARRLQADAKSERPTLSANDRSRWLTIRALVEPDQRVYRYLPLDENHSSHQTTRYTAKEIKRNCGCLCADQFSQANLGDDPTPYIKKWVPYAIDKVMENRGWDSIDIVKHALPDEEFDPSDPHSGYLYSSKPPLLPTLMAIPYALLRSTTGLSLANHPFLTVKILLVLYNLIPLILGWYYMTRLIDRFGKSDWGRIAAVGILCFATFLSTFAVTLNNHLPGYVSIIFALYAASRITDGERGISYFLCAGLFGAFAVTCELPAALIALILCLWLIKIAPKRTLLLSVPAGLLIAAAFLGTNYIAHQTIKPAYGQKRDHIALARQEHPDRPNDSEVNSFDPNDWYIYRYFPSGKPRIEKNAKMSYWSRRIGVDRGEPSRAWYFFHATIGHHGLFSLSPIWFLTLAGLALPFLRHKTNTNSVVSSKANAEENSPSSQLFAATVFFISAIFMIFYISRPQGDRSYGGVTCGLRWFFPLIPFWILSMLGVLDRLGETKTGRVIVLTLLSLSILSTAYPLWNPWSHPWLYDLLANFGWLS